MFPLLLKRYAGFPFKQLPLATGCMYLPQGQQFIARVFLICDSCELYFLTSSPLYLPGSPGAVEGKLGKNRTEADLRRYIDERQQLEKEREEVRSCLATLKKERKEIKEQLTGCQGKPLSLSLSLTQNLEASNGNESNPYW